MTVAYNPLTQPELGPMVFGDLCDIRVYRNGRREYCGEEAANAAVDADGATRLLCADHVAKLFPPAA